MNQTDQWTSEHEEARERAKIAEEKLQEEKAEVALPVGYIDTDVNKTKS